MDRFRSNPDLGYHFRALVSVAPPVVQWGRQWVAGDPLHMTNLKLRSHLVSSVRCDLNGQFFATETHPSKSSGVLLNDGGIRFESAEYLPATCFKS